MSASILTRIDIALEKARWRKLELRGIYLDPTDYAAFAKAETARYRKETGSKALVWPLSYEHVLILGKSLLPVKEAVVSAVYATSGESIAIPKRLSKRTAQVDTHPEGGNSTQIEVPFMGSAVAKRCAQTKSLYSLKDVG